MKKTVLMVMYCICFVTFPWITHRQSYHEVHITPEPLQAYYQLKEQNQLMLSKYETLTFMLREHFWTEDEEKIVRVAELVVKEAFRQGVDPHLVYGVLRIENPWLENWRVSHAGAVGLMQVMPSYWNGNFPECGDMFELEGNMCYGVRILKYYLETTPTQREGLLQYNGCASRRKHCISYPSFVDLHRNNSVTHFANNYGSTRYPNGGSLPFGETSPHGTTAVRSP
jgi:hypothetical protein